jgi:hypothetical protein
MTTRIVDTSTDVDNFVYKIETTFYHDDGTKTLEMNLDGTFRKFVTLPNGICTKTKYYADGSIRTRSTKNFKNFLRVLNVFAAISLAFGYLWNLADPESSYAALGGHGILGCIFWFLQPPSGTEAEIASENSQSDDDKVLTENTKIDSSNIARTEMKGR